MKFAVRHLMLLCILLWSTAAFADRVEVKGVGTSPVAALGAGGVPGDGGGSAAFSEAKKAAWRAFVARLNASQQKMIAQNEAATLENVDTFIIEYVILETSRNTELNTTTVVARFAFNDTTLSHFLEKLTVSKDAAAPRSSDSLFSFLFMARKQASVKQFDQRRTDVEQSVSSSSTAADKAVSSESMKQRGGNTLRKEDEVTYAVTSSQDLDAAMGDVITAAGIEYVGYEDVVGSCGGPEPSKFQKEYVHADEMTPATRAAVIGAVRSCTIKYFATGTVDTGVASKDPVSGLQQVFVSVRAQLWDVSQKLPRKIGSVGPKQFSGLGPDQAVASKNALTLAARELAQALVDQLNAKGIR